MGYICGVEAASLKQPVIELETKHKIYFSSVKECIVFIFYTTGDLFYFQINPIFWSQWKVLQMNI